MINILPCVCVQGQVLVIKQSHLLLTYDRIFSRYILTHQSHSRQKGEGWRRVVRRFLPPLEDFTLLS